MDKEKWVKWHPSSDLDDKYYIDSIIDTIDEFQILFVSTNSNRKLRILFEHGVDVYRCTEERFRLKLISKLNREYGNNFYSQWTFFRVENSDYFKWLEKESDGLSEPFFAGKGIHLSFITDDLILDVISFYEPKIEFVD